MPIRSGYWHMKESLELSGMSAIVPVPRCTSLLRRVVMQGAPKQKHCQTPS